MGIMSIMAKCNTFRKYYEMYKSWYENFIKQQQLNIPYRYLDMNEVYKERAKLNLLSMNPDLEHPDVPDLYYRSVVEKMNKIKDKPITANDLMNVDLSMIGSFEDYVILNSKSDDKLML